MQVDKKALEKAAREVLGQVDKEKVDPYYFEWPEVMCQVAELAGYDPGEDFWETDEDGYNYKETPLFFAIDEVTTKVAIELDLIELLG